MRSLTALLVLIFTAAAARGQSGAWADKLFANQTSHDFGNVPRGAQLKHTFKITNIYKVPLEITNIRVTCGCLSVTGHPRVLQPNDSADFIINMDANRFNGPKTVRLYVTVGPEYVSTATLTLSANARLDVVFNPGEIDFGLVSRGQTPTRHIDVEYVGSFPWAVSEIVKNSAAPFGLRVEELRTGHRGYRIFATLKPDAPAGAFKQEVLLKTNDPSSPALTFNIVGNVQASLSVAPANLHLGGVKVGQTESRKVIVRGQRPFRILGIDGQGDGVTAHIPDRESVSHVVEIRFQPTVTGQWKKALLIRTNLDNQSVSVTVEANSSE
ncbi:MAG: DUF1573 domain-containing protein [Gemmataceae bacterium]|nr:DUF1573 domain-containing protein [Gemmataceae bacterium]MCI0737817.1 DUF1573 domain-containing protein [Gemmataceae bacterium]